MPEDAASPAWAEPGEAMPDPSRFLPIECFVAGAIATLPMFAQFHPAWCLPIAVRALEALGDYDPDATPENPPSKGPSTC